MRLTTFIGRTVLTAGFAMSLTFAQGTTGTGNLGATGPVGKAQDPNSTVGQPTTPGTTQDNTRSRTGNMDQSGSATGDRSMDKKPTDHSGHMSGAAGHSGAGGRMDGTGSSMVGKSDSSFMMKAAMGGMAEVQMAQMAQQKASSQEVKDYARKLEQHHTEANDKLKAIAQERQVPLPTDIGSEYKMIAGKLQNLSGSEFDRAYIKAMVADHRKDVREFEKQSARGMDSDLKSFASSALPTLKEHLQSAEQLSTSSRSRKMDK
ncbi:MAG: DUF4142 domain-containing protein [Bryobacteraceae bacterium]|nr:DUF4142 domain-containing protein [Bryobacteraceae bacterium]